MTASACSAASSAACEVPHWAATSTGVRVAVQGVGTSATTSCKLPRAPGREADLSPTSTPSAVARVARRVRRRDRRARRPIFDVDVRRVRAVRARRRRQRRHHPAAQGPIIAGARQQPARRRRRRRRRASQRGILYAPDYVINAGGLINVTREYLGGSSEAQVDAEIQGFRRASPKFSSGPAVRAVRRTSWRTSSRGSASTPHNGRLVA